MSLDMGEKYQTSRKSLSFQGQTEKPLPKVGTCFICTVLKKKKKLVCKIKEKIPRSLEGVSFRESVFITESKPFYFRHM